MDIGDRLNKILADKSLTIYDLSKLCGIAPPHLFRITKKETKKPQLPTLAKIADALKVNLEWLRTGNGNMLLLEPPIIENTTTDVSEQYANTPHISYTQGVPYYDTDFIAGFDIILNDQNTTPQYRIDFKKYNDADCWCNVTGHSMEPSINHGDIIAIKEVMSWADFLPFGEIYGIVTDEFRTVKIITGSNDPDYFTLRPINPAPEFQPQEIPKRIIRHVYRVLGCMKKL